MPLKLMYITKDPEVARIAEEAGVERIFVDMEYIGKADRQRGMDTVQSHHTVEDVRAVKKVVKKSAKKATEQADETEKESETKETK